MPENNIVFWILALALAALAGYLLGSINFGVLVSRRIYSQDVRELGSGNAGMTNVLRNFGRKGAALTLLGDVAKGILAVVAGHMLFRFLAPGAPTLYGAYLAGILCIVGHMKPLFFGFKGGKGVATSGGVILAIQPVLALILLSVFLIIVKVTGMVSLGSVVGISPYPVVTFLYAWLFIGQAVVYSTLCAAVVSGLVVWMHRGNIRRIRAGTEYRFGQKKEAEDNPPRQEPEDLP